jgi:hypothetical protein
MPTFRLRDERVVGPNNPGLRTLTTPIAYMTSLLKDPFADSKGAIFNYSVAGYFNEGWILWSFGPDTDEADHGDINVNFSVVPPRVSESTYFPGGEFPSAELVANTYDPSNGTTSDGDIYRPKD